MSIHPFNLCPLNENGIFGPILPEIYPGHSSICWPCLVSLSASFRTSDIDQGIAIATRKNVIYLTGMGRQFIGLVSQGYQTHFTQLVVFMVFLINTNNYLHSGCEVR